ncbi:MAG: hypothetical protein J7497_16415, partial [Chitinophagaceae bacterium]|nr:hypothetical protein [Chitinophagaceae bacterium]
MTESTITLIELVLKIIGGAGAFVLFLIGLKRYQKDQIWNRQEFIAREMKDFQNDPSVKNALLMLDWEVRHIQLFPDKEKPEERYVIVDRQLFCRALSVGRSNT